MYVCKDYAYKEKSVFRMTCLRHIFYGDFLWLGRSFSFAVLPSILDRQFLVRDIICFSFFILLFFILYCVLH